MTKTLSSLVARLNLFLHLKSKLVSNLLRSKYTHSYIALNPFLANVPISYPLKTTEHQRYSGVFWGYKMGILVRNGIIFPVRLESEIGKG